MPEQPFVSIIIPTHNRKASLLRALEGLRRQDYPHDRMEVIVVADGCTDGTPAALDSFVTPWRLSLLSQTNLGPSGARNAGAQAASGEYLIFVDDDVEPLPRLVSGHVARHLAAPCQPFVVVGYYPTELSKKKGFYPAFLGLWWENLFSAMAVPGHRFRFFDVFTGNLSMQRATFEKVGGFETALRCHEDYEIGVRLIRHGAAFGFSRTAIGLHHETSDIHRSVRRKREEGNADVWLARTYPELVAEMPLSQTRIGLSQRIVRDAAFRAPWLCRAVAGIGRAGTIVAEALGSRRFWARACHLMFVTGYWQGVATACKTKAEFRLLLSTAAEAATAGGRAGAIEIDLEDGIEAAERRLNNERPRALVLRSGDVLVGVSQAQAGTERLHAGHLRPLIAYRFPYHMALGQGIAAPMLQKPRPMPLAETNASRVSDPA